MKKVINLGARFHLIGVADKAAHLCSLIKVLLLGICNLS